MKDSRFKEPTIRVGLAPAECRMTLQAILAVVPVHPGSITVP